MKDRDGKEIEVFPSLNCISGVLCNCLKYNKILVPEEDFYCSNQLLKLKYCAGLGVTGFMEKICIESAENMGIKIDEIKIQNYKEFVENLYIYKSILVNEDCKYLTYHSVFNNVKTFQKRHFILSYLEDENIIKICDSFVPTAIASVYEGVGVEAWLVNPENKYLFLNIENFKGMKNVDYIQLITESIDKYFECIEEDVFGKMRREIIKESEHKNFFYESATSIAVGGVYLSRRLFVKYLEKCNGIEEDNIRSVNEIVMDYIQLRVLLLKHYLETNNRNLSQVLNKIDEIEKKEIKIYERINRDIRT